MENTIEINGITLEVGQYGEKSTFINDKLQSNQMIQFMGLDSEGDLRFQYDPTGDHRLTMSKNTFPIHVWKTDPNIERKTTIVMYPKC